MKEGGRGEGGREGEREVIECYDLQKDTGGMGSNGRRSGDKWSISQKYEDVFLNMFSVTFVLSSLIQ